MKREKSIKIRLTEVEHQKLLEMKTCATLAQYIREKALQDFSNPTIVADQNLIISLNKIGVNLNQVAKFCNQIKISNSTQEKYLLDILKSLSIIQDQIQDIGDYYAR